MPRELAWIIPVRRRSDGSIDNTLPDDGDVEIDNSLPSGGGGRPSHPIALPPLPPNTTLPAPPPRVDAGFPIFIPDDPTKPNPAPPGTIWPPLNPSDGVPGKGWLVVIVVGAGGTKTRWIKVDGSAVATPK